MKTKDLLINNAFNSPYFIFIKSEVNKSNSILEKLGLSNWNTYHEQKSIDSIEFSKLHFYTYWLDGWFHIMDDWNYTLWFDEDLKKNLLELSNDFEIFTCSVGDTDQSFDFFLYRNGELVREYVVEDPNMKIGEVVKDVGIPLEEEKELLKIDDTMTKVISIAQSIGINTNYGFYKIKTYWREELDTESFVFNEEEY